MCINVKEVPDKAFSRSRPSERCERLGRCDDIKAKGLSKLDRELKWWCDGRSSIAQWVRRQVELLMSSVGIPPFGSVLADSCAKRSLSPNLC
jgi:hypothetical protein